MARSGAALGSGSYQSQRETRNGGGISGIEEMANQPAASWRRSAWSAKCGGSAGEAAAWRRRSNRHEMANVENEIWRRRIRRSWRKLA